jgi:hypothetical protein
MNLLARLTDKGIVLETDGEHLVVETDGPLTEVQRQFLFEHKPELIRALVDRGTASASFPVTADLLDAVREVLDPGAKLIHAVENGHEVGHPLEGIAWALTNFGTRPSEAPARPPRADLDPALGKVLTDVARAEANRYRGMTPAARGRYLALYRPYWWQYLSSKRRTQIEALPTE